VVVELGVGVIIAWAARKGGRVAKRIDGLTDQMIDRGWQVISSELGADPAIQRVVSEARDTGDAGPAARADAAAALQRAAAQDAAFAKRLRAALPAGDGGSGTAPAGRVSSGRVEIGDNASGRIKINTGNKIINKVRASPAGAIVALLIVAAIAVAVVFGLMKAFNGSTDGPAALAGSWHASDGSGTKTFNTNGACDGFYYNNGKPLDIGGPMSCTIDSSPGADGRYTLTVKQPPNQDTYKVRFDSDDHAVVYTADGEKLYEMSRS
jgi:hypothetical protein